MSSFRKLQRLSPDERRLLAQGLVLLPLTFLGVYVLGISRWQRILIRLALFRRTPGRNLPTAPSSAPSDEATIQRARVIALMVKIAAHHGVYRATCLQQALVLWFLLRRNQIESEIRFGARKEEGQLKAHAWVECFGLALNEDEDLCQQFSPFEGSAVTGAH